MRSSGGGRRNKLDNRENLKERTKKFALRIIEFVERLPKTTVTRVIGGQLLRCGTSVGANYRAACRAKSRADFIAKMASSRKK